MLNQMNKHMNHLFTRKQLFNIEAKEHGKQQTAAQLVKTEQREHNLKKVPTLRQAMEAEYAEHHNSAGDLIVKTSKAQNERGARIYRRK